MPALRGRAVSTTIEDLADVREVEGENEIDGAGRAEFGDGGVRRSWRERLFLSYLGPTWRKNGGSHPPWGRAGRLSK